MANQLTLCFHKKTILRNLLIVVQNTLIELNAIIGNPTACRVYINDIRFIAALDKLLIHPQIHLRN
jgi:hypothetical protein